MTPAPPSNPPPLTTPPPPVGRTDQRFSRPEPRLSQAQASLRTQRRGLGRLQARVEPRRNDPRPPSPHRSHELRITPPPCTLPVVRPYIGHTSQERHRQTD